MVGDKGMEESSEAVSEAPGTPATAASRTVFLSYASPDAEVANQVCQYLESHGGSCWMAPRDVKPGAAYADAIVRAINDSKALVLVPRRLRVPPVHRRRRRLRSETLRPGQRAV